MQVDLLTHLAALGFGVVTPFTYQVRGGAVLIGTPGAVQIIIDGGNDFCVTDIFVFVKGAGLTEGADFRMRDITNNVDFQNVTMPVDTGTADRPKIPIQTVPGQPSMLDLPWILQAGTVMEFTAFARYVAIDNFDVVLNGYKLNTVGGHVPYLPYVYMFNGSVANLAADTYGVKQEIRVQGPSDFLCTCVASNWDRTAANVDIREMFMSGKTGASVSKRILQYGLALPRPYGDAFEVSFPVPWTIPNGSPLAREISNYGTANERRPELFLFGFFDKRTEAQKERSQS